jgi:hypothetical protein
MKVAAISVDPQIKLSELIAFLNSLPDDEVLEAQDIAKRFHANPRMLRDWARSSPKLSFHCFLLPVKTGKYVYGNPRAIIAVRKHIAKTLGGK